MMKQDYFFDYDTVFYSMLESSDQDFSQGRAKMNLQKKDNKIKISIQAKDQPSFRAMKKSISNTQLILEKVRGAI